MYMYTYILLPKAGVTALRLGRRATRSTLQIAECSEATSNRMWSAVTQHEGLLLWESTWSERCGSVWALFSALSVFFCWSKTKHDGGEASSSHGAAERESRTVWLKFHTTKTAEALRRDVTPICAADAYSFKNCLTCQDQLLSKGCVL